MQSYEELLKELGLDEEHIKLLKQTQGKYNKYAKKIEELNERYLDNSSKIPTYTSKQIYERVMETGETPNFVVKETTTLQNNEIKLYEEKGITSMISGIFVDTKVALDILLPHITDSFNALNQFDPDYLNEHFEDYEPTMLDELITACEELIEAMDKYDIYYIDSDRYNDIYEQGGELYQALINLNEVFTDFIV